MPAPLAECPPASGEISPGSDCECLSHSLSIENPVILLSHPTANQNVRQTALALVEAELLGEFWTCVNWKQDGLLDKSLAFSSRLRNELRRRCFPVELAPFIRTFPWREIGRQAVG